MTTSRYERAAFRFAVQSLLGDEPAWAARVSLSTGWPQRLLDGYFRLVLPLAFDSVAARPLRPATTRGLGRADAEDASAAVRCAGFHASLRQSEFMPWRFASDARGHVLEAERMTSRDHRWANRLARGWGGLRLCGMAVADQIAYTDRLLAEAPGNCAADESAEAVVVGLHVRCLAVAAAGGTAGLT
jgi:hypothetical protein